MRQQAIEPGRPRCCSRAIAPCQDWWPTDVRWRTIGTSDPKSQGTVVVTGSVESCRAEGARRDPGGAGAGLRGGSAGCRPAPRRGLPSLSFTPTAPPWSWWCGRPGLWCLAWATRCLRRLPASGVTDHRFSILRVAIADGAIKTLQAFPASPVEGQWIHTYRPGVYGSAVAHLRWATPEVLEYEIGVTVPRQPSSDNSVRHPPPVGWRQTPVARQRALGARLYGDGRRRGVTTQRRSRGRCRSRRPLNALRGRDRDQGGSQGAAHSGGRRLPRGAPGWV